ncbi:MAG TPA: HAMP domain-containing sensor histidine kinase [Polyangiaceae bacterium]|nr:HAMP domain-containing sensor histidine kinase [Polyangiaceae bacterium]
MSLHQFMTEHRTEILEVCRKKLRDDVTSDGKLDHDVALFFEEIVQALEHHHGLNGAAASPPQKSEAAARLGQQPQRAGLEPAKVPLIFGAISSAIGHTGECRGLSIDADEYNVFNQCIDTGVATSIENFWNGERAERERRIGERFGYLAHELRSALGNAALAFKLLRGADLTLSSRTAAVLANNLRRMENLVSRTLGSAQLESQLELELAPVRVATVLRQLQASAIPDRAIWITLELDESLHVNADEMLLTSAISNLLQNALEFSRTGACVTLSCWAGETGVVVEVEDECGGLPPGEPNELLFPHVRGAEQPTKPGLGLAITQRAVEAMGGSVHVENHPGHGCSIQLKFPLARPSRRSAPPPTPLG